MLAYPDGLYQYVLATCVIHPQHIYYGYKYGKYHCAAMGLTLFGTSGIIRLPMDGDAPLICVLHIALLHITHTWL